MGRGPNPGGSQIADGKSQITSRNAQIKSYQKNDSRRIIAPYRRGAFGTGFEFAICDLRFVILSEMKILRGILNSWKLAGVGGDQHEQQGKSGVHGKPGPLGGVHKAPQEYHAAFVRRRGALQRESG